eukprot:scaffold159842_cov28-Prasinocladus_malaysianus.AAC.1
MRSNNNGNLIAFIAALRVIVSPASHLLQQPRPLGILRGAQHQHPAQDLPVLTRSNAKKQRILRNRHHCETIINRYHETATRGPEWQAMLRTYNA